MASSTVAFAAGGALAGALAFSAFPPSMPSAAGSRLAASAGQMPGDTGNLCTSTRNTPTAAETALSCESVGLSSFAAHLARSTSSARQLLAHLATHAPGGESEAGTARAGSAAVNGSAESGGGGAARGPDDSSTTSGATCEAAPAHLVALPGSFSASASVSSSATGGAIAVRTGGHGLAICVTAPSTPKLRGAPATSMPSPTLPRLPGARHSTTPHHHHRGGLGALGGLLGGLTGGSGL